jgi:hypothetical protein
MGARLCAGVPFPRNFQAVAKNILKKLFRVYAHIYHSHYNKVRREACPHAPGVSD